jgi:hypothetical protein
MAALQPLVRRSLFLALLALGSFAVGPGCGGDDRSDARSTATVPGPTAADAPPRQAKLRRGRKRGPIKVVAVGDIACEGDCGQDETARLTRRLKPDLVLGLGDFQYDRGTPEALRHYDRAWGRFKRITYPTFGNSHDCYGEPDGECGLFSYFNSGGPRRFRPESAYRFHFGRWRFVSLPSPCATSDHPEHCGPGRNVSAWNAWLRRALFRKPRRCTLAFWHAPYWSSDTSEHPDDEGDGISDEAEELEPWAETLYAAGTDILLAGHQHAYERWHPMNPRTNTRDDLRGIRSWIVGTGGIGHYSWKSRAEHVAVQNDDTLGVLELTLRRNRYDWRFVPVAGESFTDSGSARCH